MKSGVKLYRKPRLKDPYLIAAWPGMGNVALKTARYLQEKTNAQEMGEIPYYTIQVENPRSSQVVLEKLTEMLGIHIDLTELERQAENNEKGITKYIHKIKEQLREEQEFEKEDKGPGYLH